MKLKVFESGNAETLEKDVNEWLESVGDIEVGHISQSSSIAHNPAGHSHVLTLLYRDKKWGGQGST